MLTQDEMEQIEKACGSYPQKRAGCVEALKIVQRRNGWVTDDALADVADYLGMSRDEVDSVATFYNLIYRKPVGRHVILLCDSVSCWMVGYEELRDAVRDALGIDYGQTTADGRFTLLPVCCLGACDRAPALMVDRDFHGNIGPHNLTEVLAEYE